MFAFRRKRKRSDSILWQNPLHRQKKNPKSNVTTQKRYPPKMSKIDVINMQNTTELSTRPGWMFGRVFMLKANTRLLCLFAIYPIPIYSNIWYSSEMKNKQTVANIFQWMPLVTWRKNDMDFSTSRGCLSLEHKYKYLVHFCFCIGKWRDTDGL